MKLPPDYRVQPEDVGHAFHILFVRLDSSDEEIALAEIILDSQELYKNTGVWPTIAQADAYGWQKADAYWQERFGKNAPRHGNSLSKEDNEATKA
jgi:hypothetical protein